MSFEKVDNSNFREFLEKRIRKLGGDEMWQLYDEMQKGSETKLSIVAMIKYIGEHLEGHYVSSCFPDTMNKLYELYGVLSTIKEEHASQCNDHRYGDSHVYGSWHRAIESPFTNSRERNCLFCGHVDGEVDISRYYNNPVKVEERKRPTPEELRRKREFEDEFWELLNGPSYPHVRLVKKRICGRDEVVCETDYSKPEYR